jgi:pyruvate-formate lyase-activating enzyme
MGCDVDAFKAAYLPGTAIPASLADGWQLTAVLDDTVRTAIDLVLEDPTGRRVIVYVERRIEGVEALASTSFLNVSYYEPEQPIDGRVLARTVRGVGAMLRARESLLDASAIDGAFQRREVAGVQVGRSVELRINRDCNEECLFCNTPPDSFSVLAGRPQVLDQIEQQYTLGYRDVTFTGRETTLDPNLEEYVHTARARGYKRIGIQTNGTALASQPFLARLLAAGLNEVQFSLHTFRRETFSVLVGKPSLLDKTKQGLANALAVPSLRVSVLFVVTTMNAGELESFVDQLSRDYPRPPRLIISPVAPVGWGEKRLDLIPRLTELRPIMARALSLCDERGVDASIPHRCGLPLCATPPRHYEKNMDFRLDAGHAVEAMKKKGPHCGECVFDNRCVGVWKHYFEVYDPSDLVPVRELPVGPTTH